MPYFTKIKIKNRKRDAEWHFIEADNAWMATGIAISLGLVERDDPDDHCQDYEAKDEPRLWGGWGDREGVKPGPADEMIEEAWQHMRYVSPFKVFIHNADKDDEEFEFTTADCERAHAVWLERTPTVWGFAWHKNSSGPGNVVRCWAKPGLHADEWWTQDDEHFVRRGWSAPEGLDIKTDGDWMYVTSTEGDEEVKAIRTAAAAAYGAAKKAAQKAVAEELKGSEVPVKVRDFLKRSFK